MTTLSWRLMVAAGGATFALTAHAASGDPSPSKDKLHAEAQTRWKQAASKHNGSGVRLRYSVPEQLQPGQPAALQLQFSGVTVDGASATLRAPEGSTLVAEDGSAVGSVSLPAGRTTTLNLRVVPTGDGLQTIDVFTSQADRSSAQSVPLKVGSGSVKLKAMGKAQTTPAGEKVISLPAAPASN